MPLSFTNLVELSGTKPVNRFSSGLAQVDIAFGGGIPVGAVALVAGDPGTGKTTLLLTVAARVAARDDNGSAVYVTGEQTIEAIQSLAARLQLSNAPVRLASADNIDEIITALSAPRPPARLLVVDSLQRMRDPKLQTPPGSRLQVQSVCRKLIAFAHRTGTAVLIICHVTKTGMTAGPNDVQNDVDGVFFIEAAREFRKIQPTKCRFGATNAFGIYAIASDGIVE